MDRLGELARAAGLDTEYASWRGVPKVASRESVMAALVALAPGLGIEFRGEGDVESALGVLERRRWTEVVAPVVVGWDGALVVPFLVPAEADGEWSVEVTTEGGQEVRAAGRLYDLPADSHAWPGGVVHCTRRATVWLNGEAGYHRVRWNVGGVEGEALAIVAPVEAWGGPGHGKRRWGVFAPLYGLASPESGEAGDLGCLRRLFDAVERRGGSYVATLPILAATLDEPCQISPYSPVSRLFWNELYLELEGAEAPPIVAGTTIDYRAQYAWRRQRLEPMARALLVQRGAEIDAWARAQGVYDYAAFRAIEEVARTGWRHWGAHRDDAPLIATREDALGLGCDGARVDVHVVAQWAMQQQLEALAQHRVQLYLDLPVGVSCDAYEVWRSRELFLTSLAAGAPPDALFLGGQNWGLPPLSPSALRRDGYRYVIRCVRHHMRVAGMLRIDHVMGLFRLYCVPEGRPATDGVYLRYAADELLAILTLESHRARCALVGEDLGTVPDQVRPAMARHGLFRLHVGQWALPAAAGQRTQPAPAESVASLNTHDTPTFAGWWQGADIGDREDLRLITAAQGHAEREERAASRTAILEAIGIEVGDHLTEAERAMVATTTELAVGPAEIVLVALDDLVLDPTPHNVPGTVYERPNWQRRVDRWADVLDEARAPASAAAAIAALAAARR